MVDAPQKASGYIQILEVLEMQDSRDLSRINFLYLAVGRGEEV